MQWEPKPVAFTDSTASAFELLVVAGCVGLLVRGGAGSGFGRRAAATFPWTYLRGRATTAVVP